VLAQCIMMFDKNLDGILLLLYGVLLLLYVLACTRTYAIGTSRGNVSAHSISKIA
jgi:hypothetical protein